MVSVQAWLADRDGNSNYGFRGLRAQEAPGEGPRSTTRIEQGGTVEIPQLLLEHPRPLRRRGKVAWGRDTLGSNDTRGTDTFFWSRVREKVLRAELRRCGPWIPWAREHYIHIFVTDSPRCQS